MEIKVLLYNGEVGIEVRPLYFYSALHLSIPECRIISFGACNFCCSYCKRNGSFRDKNGNILHAVSVSIQDLTKVCDDAIQKNQLIRLSGGDPVAFPDTALFLAKYVKEKGGRMSIAHNGSSPEFITRIAPFIESAAIDLKATPEFMSTVIGLKEDIAKEMYYRSISTQKMLLDYGILVDVRTPIFQFTTLDDLIQMAHDMHQNAKYQSWFWTLRVYSEVGGCSFKTPSQDNVLWMAQEIKKEFPHIKVGVRAKWNPEGFVYF